MELVEAARQTFRLPPPPTPDTKSISLERSNVLIKMMLEEQQTIPDHLTSFVSAIKNIVDETHRSITGADLDSLIKIQNEIVDRMNEWVGLSTVGQQNSECVIKYLKTNNNYAFARKSLGSLTILLANIKVVTFNYDDLLKYQWFLANRDKRGACRAQLPQPKKSKSKGGSLNGSQDEAVVENQPTSEDYEKAAEPKVSTRNILEVWKNHPKRKSYSEIIFEPKKDTTFTNQFNVWSGYNIPFEVLNPKGQRGPKKWENWSVLTPFFNHIRLGWCENDEQFFYVLNWMADIIQNPERKSGVALGIGGDQGTGKTGILKLIGKIIGEAHFAEIHNMEDFAGYFNAAVQDTCFVLVDEVKVDDDKTMDAIKNFVTSDKTRTRLMRTDTEYKNSYARLALCSNHISQFLKLDEQTNRRFLMLESNLDFLELPYFKKHFKDKHEYFRFLLEGLDLHINTLANFFYLWDIDNFDPSQVPDSILMWKQKQTCLRPVARFMFDILCRRHNYNPTFVVTKKQDKAPGQDKRAEKWNNTLPLDDLFNEFCQFTYSKSRDAPKTANDFWLQLQPYLPLTAKQVEKDYGEIGKGIITVIQLGGLEECREAFEKKGPGMKYFFEVFDLQTNDKLTEAEAIEKLHPRRNRLKNWTDEMFSLNYPARHQDRGNIPQVQSTLFRKLVSSLNIERDNLTAAPSKRKKNITEHQYKDMLQKMGVGVTKPKKPKHWEEVVVLPAPPPRLPDSGDEGFIVSDSEIGPTIDKDTSALESETDIPETPLVSKKSKKSPFLSDSDSDN